MRYLMNNRKQYLSLVCLTATALTLTSCGGASDPSNLVSLGGVAQMGPMKNAAVEVQDLNGNKLASGTTDPSTGAFNISMAPQTAPVVIVVKGKADGSTKFTDEASGTEVTVSATQTMSSIVSDPSKSLTAPVTPLTEQSFQLAKSTIGTDFKKASPADMAKFVSNANNQVAALFGIPASAISQVPSNPFDAKATQNAGAMAMAQYSQFMKTNGIDPSKAMDANAAIAGAFAKSGKLQASDLPTNFQGLATAWTDPSAGMKAAAASCASDPKCGANLATVYSGSYSGQLVTPTLSPPNFLGAAYANNKVIAAGGKDPCASTSTATACPTSSTFSPAAFDAFMQANNATLSQAVAGTTGYTGSGTSGITFSSTSAPVVNSSFVPLMIKVTGTPGTSSRTLVISNPDGTPYSGSVSGTYTITAFTMSGPGTPSSPTSFGSTNIALSSLVGTGFQGTVTVNGQPIPFGFPF